MLDFDLPKSIDLDNANVQWLKEDNTIILNDRLISFINDSKANFLIKNTILEDSALYSISFTNCNRQTIFPIAKICVKEGNLISIIFNNFIR